MIFINKKNSTLVLDFVPGITLNLYETGHSLSPILEKNDCYCGTKN